MGVDGIRVDAIIRLYEDFSFTNEVPSGKNVSQVRKEIQKLYPTTSTPTLASSAQTPNPKPW